MLGPMGRNAGLLVVLLILLGGVFAWLLGDPGDPVNAGPGGSGSSDVTIAERLDLTAPDELHASDPGEDEPGGREAIAIEPSPDDLLADLLALDPPEQPQPDALWQLGYTPGAPPTTWPEQLSNLATELGALGYL